MATEEELRANPRPWMTDSAVEFIEKNLNPVDYVIEYGGGWSSLWWAKRAGYTHTVEADYKWAAQILHEMASYPELMTRWTLRFVPSDWNPDASRPKQYWTKNQQHLTPDIAQHMTNRYLVIDFEPDVFVIDGSIRPENIRIVDEYLNSHTRPRMIVVDNMESLRKHTEGRFSGFKQHDFHEYDHAKIPAHQNGKWCTSVWIRE